MPDWKILVSDNIADSGKLLLREKAQVDDCPEISAMELLNEIQGYEALIVRSRTKVTAGVLERAARLKVVGRMGE